MRKRNEFYLGELWEKRTPLPHSPVKKLGKKIIMSGRNVFPVTL